MDKSKLNNMMVRAASGAVYVALIVGCTLAGGYYFIGLLALLIILGMLELQRLLSARAHIVFPARVLDIFLGLVTLLTIGFAPTYTGAVFGMIAGLTLVVYMPLRMFIAVADRSEAPVKSVLYSLLSLAYVAAPLTMLGFANIDNFSTSRNIVLITFVLIWINDTGAYLTGMSIGKHKMCERLSPKKTWEGFWGGFTLCVLSGAILFYLFLSNSPMLLAIGAAYAAIVSVAGTYGDLFESLLKRTLGVKDSGNLIPGHGGILDRIDSILAVAPFTLLFVVLYSVLIYSL